MNYQGAKLSLLATFPMYDGNLLDSGPAEGLASMIGWDLARGLGSRGNTKQVLQDVSAKLKELKEELKLVWEWTARCCPQESTAALMQGVSMAGSVADECRCYIPFDGMRSRPALHDS